MNGISFIKAMQRSILWNNPITSCKYANFIIFEDLIRLFSNLEDIIELSRNIFFFMDLKNISLIIQSSLLKVRFIKQECQTNK